MKLNTIKPAQGAKRKAKIVGRGPGSGSGKTCGKGHKGQKARAGGYHKVGFEGGQMPLQRRLPKTGFNSRKALVFKEIRLSDLNQFSEEVTFKLLQDNGIINANIKRIKIIKQGELTTAVKINGIHATAGAKQAIIAAGGSIVEA